MIKTLWALLLLLSVLEVAWADITSNLTAHWPLNQSSGASVPDAAPGGTSPGTANGSYVWIPGKVGSNAITLPTGAYIDTVDIAALSGAAALTVAGWVKVTTTAGDLSFVSQENWIGNFDNTSFILKYNAGVQFGFTTTGQLSGWTEVIGGTLTVGVWTHIAGTYDGSNLRVYINAGTPAVTAKTGVLFNSSLSVLLGAGRNTGSPGDYCLCDIDDMRLYVGRALSQADIQELVDLGSAAVVVQRRRLLPQ